MHAGVEYQVRDSAACVCGPLYTHRCTALMPRTDATRPAPDDCMQCGMQLARTATAARQQQLQPSGSSIAHKRRSATATATATTRPQPPPTATRVTATAAVAIIQQPAAARGGSPGAQSYSRHQDTATAAITQQPACLWRKPGRTSQPTVRSSELASWNHASILHKHATAGIPRAARCCCGMLKQPIRSRLDPTTNSTRSILGSAPEQAERSEGEESPGWPSRSLDGGADRVYGPGFLDGLLA